MKFIWLVFIVQLLFYSLFSPLINNHEVSVLLLIVIHSIFIVLFLTRYNKKIRLVFYGAFVSRLLLMLVDLYMNHLVSIPHSGTDTEKFYNWALGLSGSMSDILKSSHELYVKFIAVFFTFVAEERMLLQYTNVLLGFSVVYLVFAILNTLNIRPHNILLGTSIVAFFPHSIFFSSILLREMLSTFFVVAAVYYLVKWYKNYKNIDFFLSIIMILVSSLFHSGVIGFLLAHVFTLLFYNKNVKTLKFTPRTMIFFIVLVIFAGWFFGVYNWNDLAIFRKLNIDGIDDVFESTATRYGGSAYLTGLKINNFIQLLLYAPIYMFFFISSPLPFNWRGLNDMSSFFMDGIIYLIIGIYIIFNINTILKNKKNTSLKYLSIIILVGIVSVLFIFGIGVQNAGTAMRHRQKIFPILTVLVILFKQSKESYNCVS